MTEINKFYTFLETSKRYTSKDEFERFGTTHVKAAVESKPTKSWTLYKVPLEKNEVSRQKHIYLIKETQTISMRRNLRKTRKN